MSFLRARPASYAVAVGATALAVALRNILTPLWGTHLPLITFYPAIVLSAWLGGLGPGLLTTLLSTAAAYLWLPRGRPDVGDAVALLLFLGIGLFVSWLIDTLQKAQVRLRDNVRDLQDHTMIRQREEETQSRLAAIVQSSDDAIIGKTLDGTITSWNAAATRMFGYVPEEAIGRSITMIIPGNRMNEEATVLAAIRRGETIDHFETIRQRKDGALISISLTVSPIRNAAGRVIGASKIARDVSARVKVEEERAILLANEHAARQDAEMANRAKDEFLAMLGHELRNPLGAIRNAIHVLERTDSRGDSAASARAVITRQVAHLGRLLDDLLDIGRVVTGKVMLDLKPLDLHELTEGALRTLRETGRIDRHDLTLDGEGVWVLGDGTRIEQIIVNLVTNALKFTPPGRSIRVEVIPEGRSAVLRVADDGIGIGPALLPRIFDLFVQGQMPVNRAEGGLGIGLTLVKRIAELHGGDVEAQSEGSGRGTAIRVSFPAIPAPASETRKRNTIAPTPRRILIVEDNDDARETLRIMLELWHHTVREAIDGPSGIEAALQFKPDVALVDVGLPVLDGYEVARQIRAGVGMQDVRLIALTGYGSPQDAQRAREAGFDAHLVKPVHPDRLMEILRVKQREQNT